MSAYLILISIEAPVWYSRMRILMNRQPISNNSNVWMEEGVLYTFTCQLEDAKPYSIVEWDITGSVGLPMPLTNQSQDDESGRMDINSSVGLTAEVGIHVDIILSCSVGYGSSHHSTLFVTLNTFSKLNKFKN